MKVKVLVGMLLLANAAGAAAQTPVRLTLDEAVTRGLDASHRVAEISAREEAARAVEAQRRAAGAPQVTVLAGYTRTNHVEEFGIPGGRVIYPDIPDNLRSRLDFQWPIFTAGRVSALTAAAGDEAKALDQDREALRADVKLEITRAYWAVITARASVDVVAEALDRTGAHLRDVRNQQSVGLIPPSDVLNIEAQQAHQQMLLIEAQNMVTTTEADFRRLVNLPPDAPFDLADRIDAPPLQANPPNALAAAARANRAERKALQIRIESAGERVTAAEAGKLPIIAAAGGYDYARPNPKIFPREAAWKPSWDLGVNFSWSLFDGGKARAEVAEAAANRKAIEERLKDFDLNVDIEVRQRSADVASARAAIAAAQAGVASATEARRVIAERFAAGVATNTDVIDAQVALLQAELDRTRALANAHLAEARLARALGQ